MDPYLEAPELWPDVHHSLVSVLSEVLNQQLRPNYYARINGFGVFLGDADAPVEENVRRSCINILERVTRSIVTVVEVLSPGTKAFRSASRESYEAARERLLQSSASLVEIDLLRAGHGFIQHQLLPRDEYRVVVSCRRDRPKLSCWTTSLQQPLPTIPVPVRDGDADVALDLQDAITAVYERGAFDLRIDYTVDPLPPLNSTNGQWIAHLLRERGLRQ
jgi:hypothetical protein